MPIYDTSTAGLEKFEGLRKFLGHAAVLSDLEIRGLRHTAKDWDDCLARYLAAVVAKAATIDSTHGEPVTPVIFAIREDHTSSPTQYLVHVTGAGRSCAILGEYGALWCYSTSTSERAGLPHTLGTPPEPFRTAINRAYALPGAPRNDVFADPQPAGGAEPVTPAWLNGWTIGDLTEGDPDTAGWFSPHEYSFFNCAGEPGMRVEQVGLDCQGRVIPGKMYGGGYADFEIEIQNTELCWLVSAEFEGGSIVPQRIRVQPNPLHFSNVPEIDAPGDLDRLRAGLESDLFRASCEVRLAEAERFGPWDLVESYATDNAEGPRVTRLDSRGEALIALREVARISPCPVDWRGEHEIDLTPEGASERSWAAIQKV